MDLKSKKPLIKGFKVVLTKDEQIDENDLCSSSLVLKTPEKEEEFIRLIVQNTLIHIVMGVMIVI
jgi:hypothetical protein